MNVKVKNVSKSFSRKKVLDKINFEIDSGNTFLYAGPNGAGKSTTINIALGFIKPDTGYVHFNGKLMSDNLRKKTGVALEFETGFSNLTVYQNFKFLIKVYKLPDVNIQKIIDKYKIDDMMNYKYGKLSKGMKRLYRLAAIELIDPDIIFLDEPTQGLDIENIDKIKYKIGELKEQGKTIFICSHNLSFAWELADYVAFLNQGKIILRGYRQEIENEFKCKVLTLNRDKKLINILEKEEIKYINKFKTIDVYIGKSKKNNLKNVLKNYNIIKEIEAGPEEIYRLIIGE